MEQLRLVFDTNIFVMAAGMPGGYIDYWLNLAKQPKNRFRLYTSPQILSETQRKLEEVVKFDRPIAVDILKPLKL